MSNEALKNDGEKVRLDLLPFDAIELIGEVMTLGAKKYAAHNWLRGFKWSRLIAAALRHLFAWARGEDNDPETGLSHLGHALCCIAFLATYERRRLGEDDRYKVPVVEQNGTKVEPEPTDHIDVHRAGVPVPAYVSACATHEARVLLRNAVVDCHETTHQTQIDALMSKLHVNSVAFGIRYAKGLSSDPVTETKT